MTDMPIDQQIKMLEAAIENRMVSLRYADHGAYSQEKDRIRSLESQLVLLKKQKEEQ